LPIVATAIGGALEIVTNNCGKLVPPGDAAALASAINELIENPALRSELGKVGPAHAKSLSDPELFMTLLEGAVRDAIEIHSGSRER
jgi:glycosyltransferase involved in cell wall biosynthesis